MERITKRGSGVDLAVRELLDGSEGFVTPPNRAQSGGARPEGSKNYPGGSLEYVLSN